MRAVLLAAGRGSRLHPYTADRPKCLVELVGRPLIRYQLDALSAAGIAPITIVTGYRAEPVRELAESLGHETVHNERYASTNMVASLMCASHCLDGGDDVLISYADLVYELAVVESLLTCHHELCTVVDRQWLRLWEARFEDPLSDAETLRLDERGSIVELGERPSALEEIEAQYVGLTRVGRRVAPRLVELYRNLRSSRRADDRDPEDIYMTDFLRHLSDRGLPLRAVPIDGGWLEVDSVGDLDLYEDRYRRGRLGEFCRLDRVTRTGDA